MTSVVQVSGGIDSTAALLQTPEPVLCHFIDYGQDYVAEERRAALEISDRVGLPLVESRVELELPSAGGDYYVPNRNAVLIMLSVNLALAKGCRRVVVGNRSEDAYKDSSPVFLTAIQNAVRLGLEDGSSVEVVAPVLEATKVDVLKVVREGGLEGFTWSCYKSGPDPCGTCPHCIAIDCAKDVLRRTE